MSSTSGMIRNQKILWILLTSYFFVVHSSYGQGGKKNIYGLTPISEYKEEPSKAEQTRILKEHLDRLKQEKDLLPDYCPDSGSGNRSCSVTFLDDLFGSKRNNPVLIRKLILDAQDKLAEVRASGSLETWAEFSEEFTDNMASIKRLTEKSLEKIETETLKHTGFWTFARTKGDPTDVPNDNDKLMEILKSWGKGKDDYIENGPWYKIGADEEFYFEYLRFFMAAVRTASELHQQFEETRVELEQRENLKKSSDDDYDYELIPENSLIDLDGDDEEEDIEAQIAQLTRVVDTSSTALVDLSTASLNQAVSAYCPASIPDEVQVLTASKKPSVAKDKLPKEQGQRLNLTKIEGSAKLYNGSLAKYKRTLEHLDRDIAALDSQGDKELTKSQRRNLLGQYRELLAKVKFYLHREQKPGCFHGLAVFINPTEADERDPVNLRYYKDTQNIHLKQHRIDLTKQLTDTEATISTNIQTLEASL